MSSDTRVFNTNTKELQAFSQECGARNRNISELIKIGAA